MDILKPELVWIENRCYRKLCFGSEEKAAYEEDELYPSNSYDHRVTDDNDTEESDNLPIKHEGHKFYISMSVPGPMMGYVLGKNKKNITRIQECTGAEIKIPSMVGNEPSTGQKFSRTEKSRDIVLTSTKRRSVVDAYRNIEQIVNGGRWKVCEFTHFVSIPVNNESIQDGFKKFKKDVENLKSVHEAVFEIPTKLHLTIAMLTLLNDQEREKAKFVLNKCKSDIVNILDGRPLKVELRGIEIMNDDPSQVDVLYGKVKESDNNNLLQIIADKLSNEFVDENLAMERGSVKLHVTLMKGRRGNERRCSFDARPLMEKYVDFFFGEMDITEIHISTRYTGKDGKYYTSTALMTL